MESDFLFDKTYTCPVCDRAFKSKTVRTGKVKLLSVDLDLRSKYQPMDSLKYDAILCEHCGYAALTRFFGHLTARQVKEIKEKVSSQYKPNEKENTEYSYEEAIRRHKLALVSAIVINGKVSERAYICLKIAWLYRGQRESLEENTQGIKNQEKLLTQLKSKEDEFILKAYEGWKEALLNEANYPICGMDETTVYYLVAELARQAKQYDEALRMISKVIVSRSANERMKEKARTVKELIKEELEKQK